ncbi:head-to-tail adaptor [Gordonia phage Rahul]|nr:head-to-tail adaptor [Gordonia phage Rahul]
MTAPAGPESPATVAAVAGWLGVPEDDTEEIRHIEAVVPAVNALVRSCHTAPDGDAWPAHIAQGATMLAARIVRRRNSPAGVEAFTELGPQYVSRYDPDLDRLLGLGGWRRLVVG